MPEQANIGPISQKKCDTSTISRNGHALSHPDVQSNCPKESRLEICSYFPWINNTAYRLAKINKFIVHCIMHNWSDICTQNSKEFNQYSQSEPRIYLLLLGHKKISYATEYRKQQENWKHLRTIDEPRIWELWQSQAELAIECLIRYKIQLTCCKVHIRTKLWQHVRNSLSNWTQPTFIVKTYPLQTTISIEQLINKKLLSTRTKQEDFLRNKWSALQIKAHRLTTRDSVAAEWKF